MDFISGFYKMYLKDRFSEIENYAEEASDIQSEQLSNLLLEAADTEWGKKYDFKTIYSYQEFRDRLPVQHLSDLAPYIERSQAGEANILWPGIPKDYILTSKENRIPIFLQGIEEIYLKGLDDSYAVYLKSNPNSNLLEGFTANVGNGDEQPSMNELHALVRANEPFLTSLLNLPKRVGTDKDGNPSAELVLKEAIGQKITSFRGTPENLELFLKKAFKKTGSNNIKELWPDLEVLFDRGPSKTQAILESKKKVPEGLHFQASYVSPEGFFGIQDDLKDPSYLLMLDLSTFYEFISSDKDENSILPLEDVELNNAYRMVITNCNGLWRCCSEGPMLSFISKKPYRFILL